MDPPTDRARRHMETCGPKTVLVAGADILPEDEQRAALRMVDSSREESGTEARRANVLRITRERYASLSTTTVCESC